LIAANPEYNGRSGYIGIAKLKLGAHKGKSERALVEAGFTKPLLSAVVHAGNADVALSKYRPVLVVSCAVYMPNFWNNTGHRLSLLSKLIQIYILFGKKRKRFKKNAIFDKNLTKPWQKTLFLNKKAGEIWQNSQNSGFLAWQQLDWPSFA
jgi:hypothetical protein